MAVALAKLQHAVHSNPNTLNTQVRPTCKDIHEPASRVTRCLNKSSIAQLNKPQFSPQRSKPSHTRQYDLQTNGPLTRLTCLLTAIGRTAYEARQGTGMVLTGLTFLSTAAAMTASTPGTTLLAPSMSCSNSSMVCLQNRSCSQLRRKY